MQMKSSRFSQYIFLTGLVLLTATNLFSLWAIRQLNQTIEARKMAYEIRSQFDDMAEKVKDWGLIVISDSTNSSAMEKRKFLENRLNELFILSENENLERPDQLKVVKELESLWLEFKTNPSELSLQKLKRFDDRLIILEQSELDKIKIHTPAIIKGTQQLTWSIAMLAGLSILIILFALYIRKSEDKIKDQLLQEQKKLRMEALSASQLKSKFLATVSHEVRTPLNGIIGLSDVLLNSNLIENDKKLIKTIHQSGKILLRIINDILDFSKIEAGAIKVEHLEFNLLDVIRQVVFTLSPRAVEKSILLRVNIDAATPLKVYGDPDRLAQILFNLIGNSLKFTSKGSIFLNVEVLNSKENEAKFIQFSVKDTGVGLTKEQKENLFKPFVQGQKTGTSGEAGSGLGLSISQYLVRAMGGNIEVRTEQGLGSEFYFTLPFAKYSQETVGEQDINFYNNLNSTEKAKMDFNSQGKPKILVVEDNTTNQLIIQSMLQQFGVEADLVANGEEALKSIEDQIYDLIFMDCQMPVMDGFEATKEIRNRNINTAIVAMTANASKEDEKECLQCGMNGFLPKPITLDAVNTILKTYLPTPMPEKSVDVLKKLESEIGKSAVNKVISTYIKSLDEFRANAKNSIREKDNQALNKLGHRYKSSSATVGAYEFSGLCKELEEASDLTSSTSLVEKMLITSEQLEKNLNFYLRRN